MSIYDQCIEWDKARNAYGYGVARFDGKVQLVHRMTWAEENGPIPEGMLICHTCDNPACINIDHLWLGTHSDNSKDMANKNRGRKPLTHCRRGHSFSGDNLYIHPQGHHMCKACQRMTSKRWRATSVDI